jgi:hypothetical protein
VGLRHRPDQRFRALLKDTDDTAGETGTRGGPPVNEPDRFDFAKNLIIESGDLALQYFASVNELSIMSKGAQDMVSEADIAVEKLIRNVSWPRTPATAIWRGHGI